MQGGDQENNQNNSKKILEELFSKVIKKQQPKKNKSSSNNDEVDDILVPTMEAMKISKPPKKTKDKIENSKTSKKLKLVTPDILAILESKKDEKKIKKDAKALYEKLKKGEDLSDDEDDDLDYAGDNEADKKQVEFQKQAEKLFFNVKRTKSKETKRIAIELHRNRFTSPDKYKENEYKIKANNNPARRFVTAERAVLKSSIKHLKNTEKPEARSSQSIGWKVAVKKPTKKYNKYNRRWENGTSINLGNREIIDLEINELGYRQVISSYPNHLGNYEFEVIGAYDNIIKILNRITAGKKEEELKIAKLMRRFAQIGKPITQEDLKHTNIDNIKFLNHLAYHLFVKETTRWMRSTDDDCKFPAATIMSYILELLCSGELSFNDVFSKDAEYNPLTSGFIFINKIEVWKEIEKLNKLYNEKFLQERARKFNPSFFKKHKNSKIKLIATPEYLHNQFRAIYGGSSDSEGEDYNQLLNINLGERNWYTSDEVNSLLDHQIEDDEVRVMRVIDLTQHQGATLQDNLQQVQFDIILQQSIGLDTRAIALPILINHNHWVALYIHFNDNNRNAPTISYFDPFGNATPEALEKILKTVFPNSEPIVNHQIKFQWDTYNCGPWIVAILTNLINSGCLPDEQFDIEMARQNYQSILSEFNNSDSQEESPRKNL